MVELSALEGALPTDDDLDVTFSRVGDDRIAEDGHRVMGRPIVSEVLDHRGGPRSLDSDQSE